MGAKAMDASEFDLLRTILTEPMEVEEQSGRFSYRPFPEQRDLFFPEALVGNANYGVNYVIGIWQKQRHIQSFFDTQEDYHSAVAQFLMVVALADAATDQSDPLYPGYRLIPQGNNQ